MSGDPLRGRVEKPDPVEEHRQRNRGGQERKRLHQRPERLGDVADRDDPRGRPDADGDGYHDQGPDVPMAHDEGGHSGSEKQQRGHRCV
jgi:hypothetical protein